MKKKEIEFTIAFVKYEIPLTVMLLFAIIKVFRPNSSPFSLKPLQMCDKPRSFK
jgi:hypothetical protein